MSFLQRFGQGIKKAFTDEAKYEPAVAKLIADLPIPQAQLVAAGLNVFQGILGTVESLFEGPGKGPAKLETAVPVVIGAIENSGFLSGKHVADVEKYKAAVTRWTSDFADILNTLEETQQVAK